MIDPLDLRAAQQQKENWYANKRRIEISGKKSAIQEIQDRKKAHRLRQVRRRHGWMLRRGADNLPAPYRYLNGERVICFSSPYDLPEFAGSSFNRKKYDGKAKEEKQQTSGVEGSAAASDKKNVTSKRKRSADRLRSTQTCLFGDNQGDAELEGGAEVGLRMLSSRTKRKIREKIGAFFRIKRATSTFVTLSFITKVQDWQAVKLLNKFMSALRKQYGKFEYIWVIERQMENEKYIENPHFHIIVDRRLSIDRCNSLWVLQQYNDGLMGYSKKMKMLVPKEIVVERHNRTMQLLRLFRSKSIGEGRKQYILGQIKKWKVGVLFNPFDIKKVKTDRGLQAYLTKYVTKNNSGFKCSTWHCSRFVSQMVTSTQVGLDVWDEALDKDVNYYVNEDTGEVFHPIVRNDDQKFSCWVRVNRPEHFNKYMRVVDQVNRWIERGLVGRDDISMRFSHSQYLRRVHNKREVFIREKLN